MSYWRRVNELQKLGSRDVFNAAAGALKSKFASQRRLGADLLSELGYESNEPPFKSESVPLLLRLLKHEGDPSVRYAAIAALGRLRSREAISDLVPLAADGSDQERLALARELSWCTWDSGEEQPDPRVTAALIQLSSDRVAEVRNWATFSLAGSDEDTEEVRAALWRRARDRHYDARMEAFRGLARRRDDGAVEPMKRAIRSIGPNRWGHGSWMTSSNLQGMPMIKPSSSCWRNQKKGSAFVDEAEGAPEGRDSRAKRRHAPYGQQDRGVDYAVASCDHRRWIA